MEWWYKKTLGYRRIEAKGKQKPADRRIVKRNGYIVIHASSGNRT